MAEAGKPLPIPDPVTRPFWESLKAHAIRLQRCEACRRFVFYPRALCPFCAADHLVWTTVSGRGVVHAFTIPHGHPNPAFGASTPYVVALIELEEGVRMLSNLVDVDATPAAVTVGLAVEIVYDDVTPDVTLPRFRPRRADEMSEAAR